MTPISKIRNLGPATEAAFAKVGLHSAEALHAIGADEAYLRLLRHGQRPHFIAYYVLVLGLQDRNWDQFHPGEKEALRARFDALKKAAQAGMEKGHPPALEMALSFYGVIAPRARNDQA